MNYEEREMRELLERARSGDFIYRALMAENPETPPEVLEVLSEDKEVGIRSFVASNPNTLEVVRERLMQDEEVKRGIAELKRLKV